ncbi:MAG: porin [Burkholderiales bacterium]|nr:MAG: porin [Burkholderiales bacterium]
MKLLALAVGGLMAGVVSAQSANVTLYGVLDLSLSSERSSGTGAVGSRSATYVDSGGLSGSRWGLRGSESLGGGLNAVFVAESGFLADTGAAGQGGRLFGRQVFVGLNGGFGSLTLGRQYSPLFSVLCEVDIDGCSSFSIVGNHHLTRPGALRVDNTVVYATPNMSGFTAAVMWGAGESVVGTNAARTLSANLQYKAGPLYAGFGYADVKNAAGTASDRTWTAGGAFDAGVAKLSANYLEGKNTATNVKFKGYQVGAAVPFGATTALVNVGEGKIGAAKNRILMVGADHSLSKRTTAYARVGISNNNGASNLDMFHGNSFGASGSAATVAPTGAGSDERIISLGVRHRF